MSSITNIGKPSENNINKLLLKGMITILTIVGARPQFIKAAALSREIRKEYSTKIREVILHTGQHYDTSMSEIFFREMQIPVPDYKLDIGSDTHGKQTGKMLQGIETILLTEKPDGVIVYGDTNSTLAGALAAAKLQIPVIHIEAGLRSYNKRMPEEINRITCDHVSTLLFSPTLTGVKNLLTEGIVHSNQPPFTFDHPGVYHCGDLMYDNTLYFNEAARKRSTILRDQGLEGHPFMLATIHRPFNTDVKTNLKNILHALHQVSRERRIPVILPLHPRTVRAVEELRAEGAWSISGDVPSIRLLDAVSFLDMICLETDADLILTDSGGVQKEAWFLKKPVVVLREETEWIEIIESGNGKLTGASPEKILEAALGYLDNPPASFPPIFGNGHAAREILEVLTSVQWQ